MSGDLTEHFSAKKMSCKCGCGFGMNPGDVSNALLTALESLRADFGRSVTITSGCRCPAHNKAVGGKPDSRHLYGDAADIKVRGVPAAVVSLYCDKLVGTAGGVGSYPTFTHLDMRGDGKKARWSGN